MIDPKAIVDSAEQAIRMPFNSTSPDTNIDLCTSDFEVFSGTDLKFNAKGDLFCKIEKSSTPFIRIGSSDVKWPSGSSSMIGSDEELLFKNIEFECKGSISGLPLSGFYEFAIHEFKRRDDFFPQSIFFLIPNSRLDGRKYIKNEKKAWAGRIKDSCDKVEIAIDEISLSREEKRKPHVSHIVELKAKKGHFSIKDFEHYARILQQFFSFINGSWIAPLVGFAYRDDLPEIMWANCTMVSGKPKMVANWYVDSRSTFDDRMLCKTFDFLANEYNSSLFQHCLSWYFESMGPDYQKAILSNHIALEMLSWGVILEGKEILSEDGFDGLTAADKISLLLNEVGISNVIPKELGELQAYATANKFITGPETISKIRNSLVHPKKKHRDALDSLKFEEYAEAQRLGLWYLENCLLYLLKYTGRMFNPIGAELIHDPFHCSNVDYNT